MKSLARWLAAWACFGMLIGPTVQTRAADPPGGAPAAAAPKEERESERLDLSYVPADAVAAIIVHPQAVLTGPEAELAPVEVITAAGLKTAGFDPVKIRKAIVFIRPPADPRDPAAAIILQFSEPYSQAAVVEKSRGMEVEIDGKKFIEPAMFNPALIYFPDDKTLIFATPQLMKQMLTGKEAETPLVGLLRKTNLSSDLTAVVSIDMVRPQLKQLMARAPPLPPPLQGFLKAPDLLSAVLLRADVGDKFKASLTLRARDEGSSAEVEQLINQALEIGKQMVLAQVTPRPRPAPDPVEAASLKYTQRLLDKFLGAVKPVRKGQNVTISFETGSSVATIGVLVALLLPAIQAARAAANRNTNMNKLRQIAIAMHNYESAHRHFPARAIFDKDGKPLLSWRVMLLPQLEENDLYRQFQLVSDLQIAGFVNRGGKGSHRNFEHPKGVRVTLSGQARDDAKPYQERAVKSAIAESQS